MPRLHRFQAMKLLRVPLVHRVNHSSAFVESLSLLSRSWSILDSIISEFQFFFVETEDNTVQPLQLDASIVECCPSPHAVYNRASGRRARNLLESMG